MNSDDINNRLDKLQTCLMTNPSAMSKEQVSEILDEMERNAEDEDSFKASEIIEMNKDIRSALRLLNDWIRAFENGDTYGYNKLKELNNKIYAVRYKYNSIM